ncbi:hypothetical protein FB451DRAFT_1500392 [Mycena latifolia]|nr:hypothetical protein FB451DRAFT_1500392 [Mycena latifolia]
MPSQLSVTEIRLKNLIDYLTVAVSTLQDFSDVSSRPFLIDRASGETGKNAPDCLTTFTRCFTQSSPSISTRRLEGYCRRRQWIMLGDLCSEVTSTCSTLHKIHVFVNAQHDGSTFKRLFRQSETTALLKECQQGLQQALDVFKLLQVKIGTDLLNNLAAAQDNAEKIHNDLLQLIATLADDMSSDQASSITGTLSYSRDSSTSFLLLPAEPQIFHGRESELNEIVKSLNAGAARIAILGPGGIGKTSLARAALHHPQISARFPQRFFVPCDSATSSIDLASIIASHLGLKAQNNPTKSIIRYLQGIPPCLLVLDNFETPWEPSESRGGVEEFLSLLTDIPHLALITTLRGAERPAKVAWTRPFLPSLYTLTDDAARRIFVDIADDFHEEQDIQKLLGLTGNLPLAVSLMAHLVSFEGCSLVLDRWGTEKIALLSEGYDKRSNLEVSIKLSLSSPRINSQPDAKNLLGLLSLLPDGLSDVELTQSNLPMKDIFTCKAALVRTSLAYLDPGHRLKVLVPIREYIQTIHQTSPTLVHPLRQYFHALLQLYRRYHGLRKGQIVNQLAPNMGNLQSLISHGLNLNDADLPETFRCAMALNGYHRAVGRNPAISMDYLFNIAQQLEDQQLTAVLITEIFLTWQRCPISDAKELIDKAQKYFSTNVHDPATECRFYHAIGAYFSDHDQDVPKALECFKTALTLSKISGDTNQQCIVLTRLGMVNNMIGDYPRAQRYSEQAIILARQSGNLYQEAAATMLQSYVYQGLGDFRRSLEVCPRARECMSLCGLKGGDIDLRILRLQGGAHFDKSEYIDAQAIYAQILAEASRDLSPLNHGYSLLNMAQLAISIGASQEEAQKSIDTAKSIFNGARMTHGVTHCEMILGDLKLRDGDFPAAKASLVKCFNQLRGYDAEGALYCLEKLGDVSRWRTEDVTLMSAWTVMFLGQARKVQNKLAICQALIFLGDTALTNGDDNTASSLFHAALDGFTQMDVHLGRGNCLLRLGDLSQKRGDFQKATELWNAARPLFERSSQTRWIKEVDAHLASLTIPSTTSKTNEPPRLVLV